MSRGGAEANCLLCDGLVGDAGCCRVTLSTGAFNTEKNGLAKWPTYLPNSFPFLTSCPWLHPAVEQVYAGLNQVTGELMAVKALELMKHRGREMVLQLAELRQVGPGSVGSRCVPGCDQRGV